MAKPVPKGITFIQSLVFGDWPLNKVEDVIRVVEDKYDMSKHELSYISRGGYQVCGQDHGDGKRCQDILTTFGKIEWKRVKP